MRRNGTRCDGLRAEISMRFLRSSTTTNQIDPGLTRISEGLHDRAEICPERAYKMRMTTTLLEYNSNMLT